ncbi:hypothetical protein E2C01_073298 [Portunus trituberculatus]|uniref:Uncharacterized protein n=1 Tax=Portunus trituberculatus TaxID=210409 RepID=A0A5B7I2G3_PORTR|nr:hypothetical protein [Portunus trituberculatus]
MCPNADVKLARRGPADRDDEAQQGREAERVLLLNIDNREFDVSCRHGQPEALLLLLLLLCSSPGLGGYSIHLEFERPTYDSLAHSGIHGGVAAGWSTPPSAKRLPPQRRATRTFYLPLGLNTLPFIVLKSAVSATCLLRTTTPSFTQRAMTGVCSSSTAAQDHVGLLDRATFAHLASPGLGEGRSAAPPPQQQSP